RAIGRGGERRGGGEAAGGGRRPGDRSHRAIVAGLRGGGSRSRRQAGDAVQISAQISRRDPCPARGDRGPGMITLLQIHQPGETPAPHEEERGIAIGIDLGTTNSVAAIATDGKPEILRDEQGDGLVPSVVSYAGSAPIVGRKAVLEELTKHPEKVVSSVKR